MNIKPVIDSYKRYGGDTIEVVGANIQEAGLALNNEARKAGISTPVFCEGNDQYWEYLQNKTNSRVEVGQVYRFRFVSSSNIFFLSTLSVDSKNFVPPLAIVALAEACERLISRNDETLFKDNNGEKLWVLGESEDVALWSSSLTGVEVVCFDPDPTAHGSSIYSSLRYIQRPSLIED